MIFLSTLDLSKPSSKYKAPPNECKYKGNYKRDCLHERMISWMNQSIMAVLLWVTTKENMSPPTDWNSNIYKCNRIRL